MKLLLHTCCAPCLLYPLQILKKQGVKVTGLFFNPNIHPFKEFKKRLDCLDEFTSKVDLPLLAIRDYGLMEFNRKVVFQEENRCNICYDMRLEKTVATAKENGFSAFSTTLLYSRYQNHSLIRKKCQQLSKNFDIDFFYYDFREGWQKGIDDSLQLDLYRQAYCGCLYSEQERYDNRLKKRLRKERNTKKN